MSADSAANTRCHDARLVAAAAFLTAFLPVAADVALKGRWRVVHYLAGDAYYYLAVARNIAEHGAISYDGEHPTNGFHPLWQAVEAVLYPASKLAGAHGPEAAVFGAWLVSLLLVALACAAVAWLAARECPRAAWLLPALPAGVYTAMAWRAAGSQSTLWMQANGMESALSLCLFAVVLALLVRGNNSLRAPAATGIALGALVLSRLDLIFFPLAFGLVSLRGAFRDRAALRSLAITTTIVVAMVGGYLLLSHAYAGSALPVSGRAKTTFPVLNSNTLGAMLNYLGGSGETAPEIHKRIAQMTIPFFWAAVWIVGYLAIRRGRATPWQRALLVCHGAVLLRHWHDLLFVHVIHTDYWYYPVSQIVISLGALEVIEALACRRNFGLTPRSFVVATTLVVATELGFFAITLGREPSKFPYAISLWENREAITHDLGTPAPRVVEMEDGILSFALGLPALSGTGLSLDAEASKARDEHRFLQLAWDRGYRALAITPRYLDFDHVESGMTPERAQTVLLGRYSWLRHEPGFTYALQYLSPDRSVAVFALVPE